MITLHIQVRNCHLSAVSTTCHVAYVQCLQTRYKIYTPFYRNNYEQTYDYSKLNVLQSVLTKISTLWCM